MDKRARKRQAQVDELVDRLALEEFVKFHGEVSFASIVIVIAAYKEAENIGRVLDTLPRSLDGHRCDVLVVIDGEDDGAGKIVREHDAYALIAPVNRGQGAALRLGYGVARTRGADIIVTADADGQTDPADLALCAAPVIDGVADFVNGSRRLGATQSHDLMRNTGVVVFSALISALSGTKVTDSANPVRAFRSDLLDRLILDEPQYQASELLLGAIMTGARVVERPVTMRARESGASKKGNNFAYGYRYGKVLLRTFGREWLRQKHWSTRVR